MEKYEEGKKIKVEVKETWARMRCGIVGRIKVHIFNQ